MNYHKGFTLIEIVIYVSILAVISILTVNTILVMTKSFSNFRAVRDLNASARVAMERMVREVRLADNVDETLSVLGVSPGRLVLDTIDSGSGLPIAFEFILDGTILKYKNGSGAYDNLTSSDVEATKLIFRKIDNSTVSKAVQIELTLRAGEGVSQRTENFYNTIVLRRSY